MASKQRLKRSDRETRGRRRLDDAFSEESENDLSIYDRTESTEKEIKKNKKTKSYEKDTTVSLSTTDPSSE